MIALAIRLSCTNLLNMSRRLSQSTTKNISYFPGKEKIKLIINQNAQNDLLDIITKHFKAFYFVD